MFGLQNVGIWLVFFLCFLSTLACIIYGIFNWNKGDEEEDKKENKKKDQKGEEL